MTYCTEFPDFPAADLPAIPAGFADVSWKNDASPTFLHKELRLLLWVDYADPAQRDFPECERFGLKRTDADGALLLDDMVVIASNDWNAILAAIAAERFDATTTITYDTGEPPCGLDQFFADNADGIGVEERTEIRDTLARGEVYHIGGGAAAAFALQVAHSDPAATAAYLAA